MTGNVFGHRFRVTTWGESHGPAVGVVVDGCPPRLPLTKEDVQGDLDRRRPGQSSVTTQRGEADHVEILSGVYEDLTTGTPISMIVWNRDADPSKYEELRDKPRPGHADLTYQLKYGHRDHRGGGRSSGRETVGRVAAGAIARKLLAQEDVRVMAHVVELGGVKARQMSHDMIRENTEENPVRCADPEAAGEMERRIERAREAGDSVGGIVEVIALEVPPGLGEPVFDKLDASLAGALMSIGSVKGVEVGAGFEAARMRGSEMNDPIILEDGRVTFESNNAGGVLGGISTGMPLVCRIAVKPTPSISQVQRTVDLERMEETSIMIEGRHDPAIPPRIVPVAEAMTCLVLADHMLCTGHRF